MIIIDVTPPGPGGGSPTGRPRQIIGIVESSESAMIEAAVTPDTDATPADQGTPGRAQAREHEAQVTPAAPWPGRAEPPRANLRQSLSRLISKLPIA